ncbi:MAG: AAA family ATPase, partial [Acetobacteraceae bacterium]|nr:AAA family ATPase [Acetobacteraceae bacterium]
HALPTADLAPLADLTPQRKKERTFEALLHQLEALARQQPVLLVFDDVHWIDPSSRELLDYMIERTADWPVLLLLLFRPEFQPPWTGQPHVTLLTLPRLDRQATAAMVASVAGNQALPPEIVAEIAERTDGVPLFIEELTKAVLEAGPQAPAALSAMPHPALSVPPTLHASLMARLDRLDMSPRRLRRSARRSAASSAMRCWHRSLICRGRSFVRPSISWPTPAWCSPAAHRQRSATCSSMRWCRMRPMAACCAADGRACTGGLPRRWKSGSQRP